MQYAQGFIPVLQNRVCSSLKADAASSNVAVWDTCSKQNGHGSTTHSDVPTAGAAGFEEVPGRASHAEDDAIE